MSLPLYVEEVSVAWAECFDGNARKGMGRDVDVNEPAWIGVWKGANQDGVEQTENRSVGANADGKSKNGDGGETRRPGKHSECESDVLN